MLFLCCLKGRWRHRKDDGIKVDSSGGQSSPPPRGAGDPRVCPLKSLSIATHESSRSLRMISETPPRYSAVSSTSTTAAFNAGCGKVKHAQRARSAALRVRRHRNTPYSVFWCVVSCVVCFRCGRPVSEMKQGERFNYSVPFGLTSAPGVRPKAGIRCAQTYHPGLSRSSVRARNPSRIQPRSVKSLQWYTGSTALLSSPRPTFRLSRPPTPSEPARDAAGGGEEGPILAQRLQEKNGGGRQDDDPRREVCKPQPCIVYAREWRWREVV